MRDTRINPRIVKALEENTESQVIKKFLYSLLFEEIEHSGYWRYIDVYKKQIDLRLQMQEEAR